jgi:uncharacterized protein
VSRREKYSVRLSGLSDGEHDFSFDLNEEFFASLETPDWKPEVEKGKVRADLVLEKKPGALALHFLMNGKVEVICDRCLVPFMKEIQVQRTVFVKFGDTPGEIGDDIMMIHRDDHEIEVGQFMYEFIVLALPLKRVHPDDEKGVSRCDPDMLKRLEERRGRSGKENTGDPRWDALKGIIEK